MTGARASRPHLFSSFLLSWLKRSNHEKGIGKKGEEESVTRAHATLGENMTGRECALRVEEIYL